MFLEKLKDLIKKKKSFREKLSIAHYCFQEIKKLKI